MNITIKATALTLSFAIVSFSLFGQNPAKKFIDPANIDNAIHPGENFYMYSNGNWIKNNPIPDGETSWGSYNQVGLFNMKAMKHLIEIAAENNTAIPDSISQQVGDFYSAAMDSSSIKKRGMKPVLPYLKRINSIQTKQELLNEMSRLYRLGLSSHLFYLVVEIDSRNIKQMIAKIGQSGTTIENRNYYTENDSQYVAARENLRKYINKLFSLSGETKQIAQRYTEIVLEVEKRIAIVQKSPAQRADRSKNYNKFQVRDFCKTLPGLNWELAFSELKVRGEDTMRVVNPYFMRGVDSILSLVPLQDWKIFLKWNILKSTASFLNSECVNAESAYYRSFTGQLIQTTKWRQVLSFMDIEMGDLTGQLYVREYFKPEAKARILDMVKNIRKAFENRIHKLDWMSVTTKENALRKLYAITVNVGYPDKWSDYNGLVINRTKYFENVMNVKKWNHDFRLNQLGKPVNKSNWGFTIAVDAWYNGVRNEICFPAGILQFPFFDLNADDAVNYGAIGIMIGHELSHAFDLNGSLYDADGAQRNWWTDEDRSRFEDKAKALVNQYNNYKVQSTPVNGKTTLNENIADLCGMSVAYDAFKMTKQGQSSELIDGLTPDQRFFLSRAQICRENMLPQTEVNKVINDNHAPLNYRLIGVVINIDAWYNAFDIDSRHKLYKKQEDRISIW